MRSGQSLPDAGAGARFRRGHARGMHARAGTYNAGLAAGAERLPALPRVRASRVTNTAPARREIARRGRRQRRDKR